MRGLPRADFDRVVDYVATGGYALRAYERYAKLRKTVGRLVARGEPASGAALSA